MLRTIFARRPGNLRRGWPFALAFSAGLGIASPQVAAQANPATEYPSKPIRVILGFAAGSATDILARVIATPLSEQLGQQLVIDNRPGAYSTIGSAAVANATPDGYTLLLGTNSGITIAPAGLLQSVPYDSFKDFTRIGQVATVGFTLSGSKGLPANSAQELVAHLQRNPGKASCAAANANGRVLCEALNKATKANIVTVLYKSGPQAITDLLGGQIELMFVDVPSAIARIQQNQLKSYAVVATERSEVIPQLPIARDVGLSELPPLIGWYGLFGPADLPAGVAAKLSRALEVVLAQPKVRQQIIAAGFEPAFLSPERLLPRMRSDYDDWKRLLTEFKIEPER
ncbi:MAG: Bug family tripartite tricarboxylate transporter substrate binding protein [Lautropia sp.]